MNALAEISYDMHPLMWVASVIVLSFLIGWLIKLFLFFLMRFYQKKSDYFLVQSINKHLDTAFAIFLPFLTVTIALPLLKITVASINYLLFSKTIQTLLIISFAFLLFRVLNVLEDLVFHHFEIHKEDNFKERKIRTQMQFIKKLAYIIILILTLSFILLNFESVRQLGAGLLTSAGVAGIIIGFAAQKSLANLLAGFQIAFTQPIRIDDVLIVENEWGRVEEITLTYVVVRIWDNRRLILPITYFIERPFQNWTRTTADILGSVFLYTDYTIPIDPLRKELDRVLNEDPKWDKKVSVLQVTNATERTIELRALMSARNSPDAWDLRCNVREKLISFIQKNYPESLPKTRAEIKDMPGLHHEHNAKQSF
jgi:small-conductance mechanosensitive channel